MPAPPATDSVVMPVPPTVAVTMTPATLVTCVLAATSAATVLFFSAFAIEMPTAAMPPPNPIECEAMLELSAAWTPTLAVAAFTPPPVVEPSVAWTSLLMDDSATAAPRPT